MKHHITTIALGISVLSSSWAQAQITADDIPLMRPDELASVKAQSADFMKNLEPIVKKAAASTVHIWGSDGRRPRRIAYGTVVADGTEILTKWSEIEPYLNNLQVIGAKGKGTKAEVKGVYSAEDLAILTISKEASEAEGLLPVSWQVPKFSLGNFLVASRPDSKPGAFGVVAVLERNLRETDRAHIGIMIDIQYRGKGIRVADVQAEYGAAQAGIRAGDLILKIGGRDISGLQELKNALNEKRPGDQVSIQIDSAGKQKTLDVLLSNRPLLGQFAGGRLNTMERMGGEPNRVREGFSRVVQTDMKIQADQMGGPVVNLDGAVVGISMARADRTRTYLMPSDAVMALLQTEPDSVSVAQTKAQELREQLAKQERELMKPIPQQPQQPKQQSPKRVQRYLSDLQKLLDLADRELDILKQR